MAELGIHTWRGSFGWDDYEPEPGRFDFAWLHAFAEGAARGGIELRPYIAYTPEWAAAGAADGAAGIFPRLRFGATLPDAARRGASRAWVSPQPVVP